MEQLSIPIEKIYTGHCFLDQNHSITKTFRELLDRLNHPSNWWIASSKQYYYSVSMFWSLSCILLFIWIVFLNINQYFNCSRRESFLVRNFRNKQEAGTITWKFHRFPGILLKDLVKARKINGIFKKKD